MAFNPQSLQILSMIMDSRERRRDASAQRGHELDVMNVQSTQRNLESQIDDARFERNRLMQQAERAQETLTGLGVGFESFDSDQIKLLTDTARSLQERAHGMSEIASSKRDYVNQLKQIEAAGLAGARYGSSLAPEFIAQDGQVLTVDNAYNQIYNAINRSGGGTRLDNEDLLQTIREFEGFSDSAYYDVNADRLGYGSDTITRADGTIEQVTSDSTVTREEAEIDLRRRINDEFLPKARQDIGSARWSSLPRGAQNALVSIAYNYGHIPNSVIEASQTGNLQDLADAVEALGTQNDGVNSGRRRKEAEMIRASAFESAPTDLAEVLSGQLERFESDTHKSAFMAGVETSLRDRSERIAAQESAVREAHLQREDADRTIRRRWEEEDRSVTRYGQLIEFAENYRQQQDVLTSRLLNTVMATTAQSLNMSEEDLTRKLRNQREEVRELFQERVGVGAQRFSEDALIRSGFLEGLSDTEAAEQADNFKQRFANAYAADAFNIVDGFATNPSNVSENITSNLVAFHEKITAYKNSAEGRRSISTEPDMDVVSLAIRDGKLLPEDLAKVAAFMDHPDIFTSARTAFQSAEELLRLKRREQTFRSEAPGGRPFQRVLDKVSAIETDSMTDYLEWSQNFGRIETQGVSDPPPAGDPDFDFKAGQYERSVRGLMALRERGGEIASAQNRIQRLQAEIKRAMEQGGVDESDPRIQQRIEKIEDLSQKIDTLKEEPLDPSSQDYSYRRLIRPGLPLWR